MPQCDTLQQSHVHWAGCAQAARSVGNHIAARSSPPARVEAQMGDHHNYESV